MLTAFPGRARLTCSSWKHADNEGPRSTAKPAHYFFCTHDKAPKYSPHIGTGRIDRKRASRLFFLQRNIRRLVRWCPSLVGLVMRRRQMFYCVRSIFRAHPTTSPLSSETRNGICHVCFRGGRSAASHFICPRSWSYR